MKTILIPVETKTGLELTTQLKDLGLIYFKTGKNEVLPVNGISETPTYIKETKTEEAFFWWKNYQHDKMIFQYFRLKISEAGEKILNANGIKFIYE